MAAYLVHPVPAGQAAQDVPACVVVEILALALEDLQEVVRQEAGTVSLAAANLLDHQQTVEGGKAFLAAEGKEACLRVAWEACCLVLMAEVLRAWQRVVAACQVGLESRTAVADQSHQVHPCVHFAASDSSLPVLPRRTSL